MIEITELDENLSIYKNNKVILWGAGHLGSIYVKKFQVLEIDIYAFCDNNTNIHGTKINGVSVISPDELKVLTQKDKNIVIQVTCDIDESILVKQLEDLGIKKYISFFNITRNIILIRNYSNLNLSKKFKGNSDGNHIKITKIDEKLSIYKNNKVIIWGSTRNKEMLQLLQYHNIDIFAYCTDEANPIEFSGGGTLITSNELKELAQKYDDIMVQVGLSEEDQYIENQINEMNINNWVSYSEAWNILNFLKRCKLLENNHNFLYDAPYHKSNNPLKPSTLKDHIILNQNGTIIIICMVGKTGDFTLNNTFEKNNIPYINTLHSIDDIDMNFIKNTNSTPIKIITAIREPISQYISTIYQFIGSINIYLSYEFFFHLLLPFEKEAILKDNGDFQYIFDTKIKKFNDITNYSNVENFINNFCEKLIDIKKAPFDKEKGYTIVKEGNIEVFVYQIEKLNNVVAELSEFVGTPFDELENGNVASDKWYADSYKQAQKDLKFSQEFFDKCYNSSYVSHFYSDADIEKFKNRWTPNIRK